MAARPVVAAFSPDSTGHLNPMLALTGMLASRGWDVRFHAPDGARPLVEAAGGVWCPLGEEGQTLQDAAREAITGPLALEPPLDFEKLPVASVPATLQYMPTLLRSVADLAPSFVLYDAAACWARVLADILALPSVACMSACPDSPASRDTSSAKHSPASRAMLDAVVSKLRSLYGVDFNHNHSYSAYAPYTVISTSRAWHAGHGDFPADQFHYWGPLVSERRGHAPAQGTEELQRLLGDPAVGRDGRPLVFCSLGTVTTGNAFRRVSNAVEDYYRKLCRTAALLPHVTFVFAVGKNSRVDESPPADGKPARVVRLFDEAVPDNVVVARFVDQPALLRRCAAFLTHCGQNSCGEAALAAVPVVAAPFFGDQIANALRFQELGCGLIQCYHAELRPGAEMTPRGPDGKWEPDLGFVSPESLAFALRRVLEEPSFSEAAMAFRAKQAAELQGSLDERLGHMFAYVQDCAKRHPPRVATCLLASAGA